MVKLICDEGKTTIEMSGNACQLMSEICCVMNTAITQLTESMPEDIAKISKKSLRETFNNFIF